MIQRWMGMVLAVAAFGHDMWIEPGKFRAVEGEVVTVRLRVGQELLGDPIPRSAQLIREFVAADVAGRQAVAGREGSDPAGFVRLAGQGVTVIGYHSQFSPAELTGEKFTEYLREEGLEWAIAERARRKESGAKVRELFARCAKALVWTGAGPGDRELGFPMELISESNPYAIPAGAPIPLRLVFDKKPLAGALVVAMNRKRPGEKVQARTDRNGRVRLALAGEGMWMVKAVHMTAAPAGAGADWQSYWASLTFARESK